MAMWRPGIAALLALGSGLLEAAESPRSMLERMAHNVRASSYRGILTYQQGQELHSARIVHSAADGLENDRLQPLDGATQALLRLGHPLDCRHAAQPREESSGWLSGHYAVEFDGSDRIAGREGLRLRISPRDPYRYGLNLVLDAETALPLRSETTDGAGRVIERVQFVELEVDPGIDTREVLDTGPGASIEAAHPDPIVEGSAAFAWSVSWLPAGFAERAREARSDAEGRRIETRAYSDGLAAFSVFVEGADAGPGTPGQASRGATVAYVMPRGPRGAVTVVGDIPAETARLIANAVSFPDP